MRFQMCGGISSVERECHTQNMTVKVNSLYLQLQGPKPIENIFDHHCHIPSYIYSHIPSIYIQTHCHLNWQSTSFLQRHICMHVPISFPRLNFWFITMAYFIFGKKFKLLVIRLVNVLAEQAGYISSSNVISLHSTFVSYNEIIINRYFMI